MVATVGLALVACGGDSDDGGGDDVAAESPSASGATITITDFAFSAVTVEPGATVTVVNEDGAAHTVTSPSVEFSGTPVDGNAEATFTAPDEAGEYAYICSIHPSMTGTLVVG